MKNNFMRNKMKYNAGSSFEEIRKNNGIYPQSLKMRANGKQVQALGIDGRCDWPEREQPRATQFQRRRV